MKQTKASIIYFHSGRGFYDGERRLLCLPSANLMDFFLEVFQRFKNSVLVIPLGSEKDRVTLKLGKTTRIFNVPYPQIHEGRLRQIVSIFRFMNWLASKKLRGHIRRSHYSVSQGLYFDGTLYGLLRTLIVKKKHTFIVRGNRSETVKQSSRGILNKYLALARINIYQKIMFYLLEAGKAEIWFQGQEGHERFRRKCKGDSKQRVFLLNAVLRKLTSEAQIPRLDKKTYDIVFVGNVNREKGIYDLIKAISVLANGGGRTTAVIIGEGPDQSQAMELAQRLDVNDRVEFIGYVSSPAELASLIREAKLFVLPSYTEGLPRAMIESMSLGVPVLVTPAGGIKYVIRNGKNGFLVEAGSPERLAGKIEELLALIDRNGIDFVIEAAHREAEKYSFPSRADYFIRNSINCPE
jgi:glycosyltransferase involved in cell wall biosynthesis